MATLTRLISSIAPTLVLFCGPAAGHHAFSKEFDLSKPIKLEGTVTKIDWKNPHVYFYVDVPATDGSSVNWACETRGPKGLERQGWKRDSLKAGDKVIVQGYLSRDGSHTVDGRQVTTPDGRKVLSGQAK